MKTNVLTVLLLFTLLFSCGTKHGSEPDALTEVTNASDETVSQVKFPPPVVKVSADEEIRLEFEPKESVSQTAVDKQKIIKDGTITVWTLSIWPFLMIIFSLYFITKRIIKIRRSKKVTH